MLKFLNEIANPYYKNCILNAILEKDKKDITLLKPKVPAENISEIMIMGFPFHSVKSCTNPNTSYFVDISGGICTCPVGLYGKMCKHQKSILIHEKICCDRLYSTTPEEKYFLSCVAVGEDNALQPAFYRDLLVVDDLQPQTQIVLSNIPQNEEAHCSSSTNVNAENNESPHNVEDATMTECNVEEANKMLLAEIGLMLHEKLEMGSTEANAALRKFKYKLEKAKTSAQVYNMLHNPYSNFTYRKKGSHIKVQPRSIARRRLGQPRSAVPIGKGRPKNILKQLKNKRQHRPRNLQANVNENQANAKSH